MGIKRDKYDAAFSDLIRARADFECEVCGKICPDGQATGKSRRMDNSHYYGRRHQNTRFCGTNCACLCRGCHKHFTENPGDYADWMLNKLGSEEVDALRKKHNQIKKRSKAEKEEMLTYMKAQLAYIKRRRMEGETGYITFVSNWD